jgi:hypothetical protein
MADLTIYIKPCEGVMFKAKELKFGMSQSEINNLLGKPAKFEVSNLINQMFEYRNGMIFHYKFEEDFNSNYGKEKLHTIDVPKGSGMKIFYEGIDILNDNEAVSKLSKFDTPTPDNGKFMNFYKLGICLGGYGRKKIPQKRLVSVFPKWEIKTYKVQFYAGGGRIEGVSLKEYINSQI